MDRGKSLQIVGDAVIECAVFFPLGKVTWPENRKTKEDIRFFFDLVTEMGSNVYSSFLSTFGISDHKIAMATKRLMQMGCRTKVPNLCAMMPVMKGARAPPELPMQAMKARQEICLWRGISRTKMWLAAG